MPNEEWISLNKYMERYHLGYKTVLTMINNNEIEAVKLKGQYKIKINHNAVSFELYEKVIKENTELKTVIANTKRLLEGVS